MNGTPSSNDYLDYLARCRQAFTPFAPIELPDFFAGRAHVIEDINSELKLPGRQVAIYGERGVGKTSLAVLLYFFAEYDDEDVYIFRCHKGTTFDDVCLSFLESAGCKFTAEEAKVERRRSAEIRVGPLSGGTSGRTAITYKALQGSHVATPARMLEAFQQHRALLIIDEFDRVLDVATKTRMAEMIKHFSDARSVTKIVIVGVANTLDELIGRHQSLSRSLAQIGLERMDEPELEDIIERGSRRIGVSFDPAIITKIVCVADGFPQFVHLLSLYASLYAGEPLRDDSQAKARIQDREYALGLKSAISKSEHTLQEAYESAVITTRRKSDIYELTLHAMALSEERDVQVRKLAENASYLTKERRTFSPEKFSNPLGVLIKPERGEVLTKVRTGHYKFTNPLMRAYVRLLLEYDNVVHHGGQLEFPFMRAGA